MRRVGMSGMGRLGMTRVPARCGLGFLLAVALLGCGQRSDRSNAVEGSPTVIRRGLSGEPASLDPAAVPDTFSSQVVGGLVRGSDRRIAVRIRAAGRRVFLEVDPAGTQYRFHLPR